MKFVICGAGQVGGSIARRLAAEDNDVTVIDKRADLIQKLCDSSDVRGVVGHASSPDVLEQAGAGDCDMLIAVTFADEVNLVACQVAHALFSVPMRIARVRRQSYLDPTRAALFSREHMPIDVIISPEIEVARAIGRRLQVPGAFDLIPLADGKVRVVGLRCGTECPVLDTPLRQLTSLFPDLNIIVVAIIRQDRSFVPTGDDAMLAGDEVYFVADATHLARAMALFGHTEQEGRRVTILGGGNIGLCLAQDIEANHRGVTTKVIEQDKERAEFAAQALKRTIVLNGDALDPETLEEANVQASETVIAVTNDDEVNILASLLAKRSGARRVITLVNKATYAPLVASLGIDVIVDPRATTVSTILQYVRRGRIRSVHSLREGFGEIVEAEALDTSSLVGRPLRDIRLPGGIVVGAVVRKGGVVIPRGDTVVRAGDRVVLFAASADVKTVEKLFSVRLEYF